MRRTLIALAAACALAIPVAIAAETAHHPEPHAYSFEGPFGEYDRGQIQRGFLVYKQVCSACHSMDHMAYRHLGETGGPYEAFWVTDHETGVEKQALKPGEHSRPVNVNDNLWVRQIASDVMIPEISRENGLEEDRPGRPSDHFRKPFANEYVARAANGGALPPDLSVITSARHGGAQYIRSLLMGYTGEVVDGKSVNPYFSGGLIAMPAPLHDDAVTFDDGTPATVENMATDVAAFLQWASDPHLEARNNLGFRAVVFLFVLSLVLYVAYKTVWRGQKH